MVDADILGEETVENGTEQEGAAALEGALVERHRDLGAARHADAARMPDAPDDRPAVDVADAADLALGRAVRDLGEQGQHLAQSMAALPGRPLDQAEMVEAEHVDETPGDLAGRGAVGLSGERRDDRLE